MERDYFITKKLFLKTFGEGEEKNSITEMRPLLISGN